MQLIFLNGSKENPDVYVGGLLLSFLIVDPNLFFALYDGQGI